MTAICPSFKVGKAMRHLPPIAATDRSLTPLFSALEQLDRLLENAIESARSIYGVEPETDPYRGLHISREEVQRLLDRTPGVSLLRQEGETEPDLIPADSPWCWLQQAFNLTPFDLNLIAIALAPEVDLRYERLYAYLQDDVTRKRPSVELALNLLCASATEKVIRRDRLAATAPLIRHHLLHLVPESDRTDPPLLSCTLQLDEQIVRWLLGETGLDRRLTAFCQLSPSQCEIPPVDEEMRRASIALARQSRQTGQPLHLYFQGVKDTAKRHLAEAIAADLEMPLLVADLDRVVAHPDEFTSNLYRLFREAWLQDALLYLEEFDSLCQSDRTFAYRDLTHILTIDRGIAILAGLQPWIPAPQTAVIPILFAIPDFDRRCSIWAENLAAAGISLAPQELAALGDRFRLMPDAIANAVTVACNDVAWNAAQSGETQSIALTDLFQAARDRSGRDLTALARKVEPKYTWHDIILPGDELTQLQDICHQVAYRRKVYQEWGFDRKLSLGKGLNVLFAGPPGTGKTMAAEVIASELQLDLYRIDLSQIVSKYIGETEKNLDRIFGAAIDANAILFFDEADALFGKRSEVKDAHDRYANIEIGYLLQKMEEYEGVAILATNLRQNLDEAFVRRLQFIVEFPFPNEDYRQKIWEVMFPPETPVSREVDFKTLAREVKLAGGNLKNIAISAAFYAARSGGAIEMSHLLLAARREYQKLGRTWNGMLTTKT
jgi:AAA+ superfamily predicted ATPase